jgi:acetyltransferase-like isoleucine patch superfamily enzyme
MSTLRRITRRLRAHAPTEFFFGWLLSRRFKSSGLVIVRGGFPKPAVINKGGEIHAGSTAYFPGVRLEVLRGGAIHIGSGTYLNRNVLIVAEKEVRIGRDCKIAWDVVIMDTDQHPVHGVERPRPVVIEDDVWVGCRAIILKGTHIGRGAIIGAGAIVRGDVPPGAVVAGPTASVIRQVEQDERPLIAVNGAR